MSCNRQSECVIKAVLKVVLTGPDSGRQTHIIRSAHELSNQRRRRCLIGTRSKSGMDAKDPTVTRVTKEIGG
jgi:hypothetical protein